ncbi:phospholipase A [Ramlibacter alkalitolerans]|uniref:Phospholipase A1 n=1 Tax=Ramlibacter alkalitolerans TaxID=2039631 RepID=A0ABS1JWI6_9BURK|nr:phospholipase A [Ramlibacter alkalitolerans]MBL0428643.1 phospholipase A [Ramlibacter alkalitolerans]
MRILIACLAAVLLPCTAAAQQRDADWQACTAVLDGVQRLACFDAWAKSQRAPAPPAPETAAAAPLTEPPPRRGFSLTASEGCHDTRYSELSRFWELEPGADCGTFGLRGYRPISLDLVGAATINRQPSSENPRNTATTSLDYRTTETRLQLSVRAKIAQGLLVGRPDAIDSLWFAYSQQSYWQIFTPGLSRPFRSTDHEPEFIYVLPLQTPQADRWRVRFGGLGIVHQSNGQSLPLSRSWNRVYLMAGAEHDRLQLQARVWRRLHEDAANDDNPGISDFIGRGELRAVWRNSRRNLFAATARHALRARGRGSLRLEWFRTLGDTGEGPPSGLQLHTQVFSGYGDTLLDYNRSRTVFSIGLSLVEW